MRSKLRTALSVLAAIVATWWFTTASAQTSIPNGVFVRDTNGTVRLVLEGKRVTVPLWPASHDEIQGLAHADTWAVLDDRAEGARATDGERERIGRAISAKGTEADRARTLFRHGLADLPDTERAIREVEAETEALRVMLTALDAEHASISASLAHLDETELLVGRLHPLVEAGDAGDMGARRSLFEMFVREVSVTTHLEPPTRRRQKGPQKRVKVFVRYVFGHGASGGQMYGGMSSGLPPGILPHNGTISVERELVLTR